MTAIARGSANTRWRDFVDLYALARRHVTQSLTLRASLDRVAQYRRVDVVPLTSVFAGYAELAQPRWLAWLRKNRLESTIPADFAVVLEVVRALADPVIVAESPDTRWNPARSEWE